MGTTGQIGSKLLGYVHVHVASRVYVLPVEARPLLLDDGSSLEPGFFEESAGHYGIRVDSGASEDVVRQTIERASEEAARRISRQFLN